MIESKQRETIKVNLIDQLGTVIKQQVVEVERGTTAINMEIPDHFSQGIYLVEVITSSGKITKKLVLSR
jgi:hypothetical protein